MNVIKISMRTITRKLPKLRFGILIYLAFCLLLIWQIQKAVFENLNNSSMQSEKHCQPLDKIIYMKTHKCASSSLQNILFRLAVKDNWTIGKTKIYLKITLLFVMEYDYTLENLKKL